MKLETLKKTKEAAKHHLISPRRTGIKLTWRQKHAVVQVSVAENFRN